MNPEQNVYKKVWTFRQYRKVAPGEDYINNFMKVSKAMKGETLIDLGCGTGRASLTLARDYKLDVQMVDFASNCLDVDVIRYMKEQDNLKFDIRDLVTDLPYFHKFHYGYCTDVMEHIQPEVVIPVLSNIQRVCQKVYFVISHERDKMGLELVGRHLHLTVESSKWWEDRLNELGYKIRQIGRHKGYTIFYCDSQR